MNYQFDYDLVKVDWLDSRQPSSEWRFISDTEIPKPVKCSSVGWLFIDAGDTIMLVQNTGDMGDGDDGQISGIMVIPAISVLKITKLAEVKPKKAKRKR